MGVKKCDIFYDKNSAVYYPGQTINGKVDFTFDSPKKVRGIIIEIKGEANTFWKETEKRKNANGQDEDYLVHYNGHEEYFNVRYNIFGNSSSGQQELHTGTHSFPFTCALPPGLPTSFEGEHGYVRYSIRVILDRPWKFDQEYNFEFQVISIVDLNRKPGLKEPVIRQKSDTFGCCCCESGPYSMTVSIPCSGFTAQQTLPLVIDCDNASNVKIKYLMIVLERIITFHVQSPSRKSKTQSIEVATLCTGDVERGENARFEESLTIPSDIPPSDLENCGIIDITYSLMVKAKVGGCHESPSTLIKVTIGHIPIEEKVSELGGGKWEDDMKVNETPQSINFTQPPPSGNFGWNPNQNTTNYPPQNYPSAQTTYPPSNTSYPPSNPMYPAANPTYPPSNPPYLPPNPGYPPNPASYPPPTNSAYPPTNPAYPPTNPAYPPTNPTYPPTNPTYPPTNPPYPGYPSQVPSSYAPSIPYSPSAPPQ